MTTRLSEKQTNVDDGGNAVLANPFVGRRSAVSANGFKSLGRIVSFFSAAILALLAVAPAHAADPGEGEIDSEEPNSNTDGPETEEAPKSDLDALVRVVQQRAVLKSGRFELLVGAGLVANDQMYDHWLATTTGRVHVSEWISIGATYAKYFSDPSDLQSTVMNDFEVFPELSAMRWYAGGDVTFVAMDGKFVFFDDSIVYWDLYASIGGGVTVTSRSDDPKPTGMIGAGMRIFLTDWLTLTFELRDHMFIEKFNAGNEFVNNVVGQAGLTLFIPFGFDYEYAK